MQEHLTECQRQEVFLALVTAQDHDVRVFEPRKLIAHRFGVTVDEVIKLSGRESRTIGHRSDGAFFFEAGK
jgi:hypothetical protein